jgi:hypothetical protein
LASKIDKLFSFSDADPIARLIVHYWYPANYMYQEFSRVERALARQKSRTQRMAVREVNYLRLWLATLYTTGDGFKSLNLKDDEIERLLSNPNFQNLRVFRNGTFHYQKSPVKLVQFWVGAQDRISWARSLHFALNRFFSEYRIKIAVQNVLAANKPDSN